MVDDGDDSFKRPGAVPFKWEVRPGVPKTRPGDDQPTLLQPPNELAPLKLKPFPPSNSPSPSSSSSSFISESRSRPVSPFAPPSSFKLKSPSDSDSTHCSGPPTPYFRFSSPRAGGSLPRCFFPKSLFGSKKSKSGDVKKTGQESSAPESENFYESGTTCSPSEDSSQGSVSSCRGSPLKRTDSDLSSYEKKTILMMARSRLG